MMSPLVNNSQLPLIFKHQNQNSFENFIIGENEALIESLKSFVISEECLFYLWGEKTSGKSHLLQALVNHSKTPENSIVIIHADEIISRENISIIELFDTLLIDEIESLAGNSIAEENLFNWINEAKQYHKKLILCSQISNKDEQWRLADLRSRLISGRTHQLLPLKRDETIKIFSREADIIGINLDNKVIAYLKANCPMNLGFLMNMLNQLDNITLIKKKKVTIPLIKQIMNSNLVK
jgi:DnaA family protein